MSSPGGDLGALGWFVGFWAAMTVAMMLPASMPVLARVARAGRLAAVGFVVGYLAVWMLTGLAGYAIVSGVRGLHLGALGWSSAGRYLAAAGVTGAGIYQLTRAKRRWLERCRSTARGGRAPSGVVQAVRAGLEHGRCCVACCGTLMVALYALGMMSFTWMALITIVIVGERWLGRRTLVAATAIVLVILGLGLAVAPSSVPGLTVPSPHMAAMTMR
jgi:predicted metal-binding membrane protein